MKFVQNWTAHKAVALIVQFNNDKSQYISVMRFYKDLYVDKALTDNYLKMNIKLELKYRGEK